jgi:regulator of RNase E activity RraA
MAGTSSRIFSTQVNIQCGGVPVSPGDIIFGDDDGVVIISEQEITEILEAAESIQQKEEKVLIRIKANESLLDMLNFSDHYAKIRKNQESKLTFKV